MTRPNTAHRDNTDKITSKRKRFACEAVSKAAVLEELTEGRLVKALCGVPRESFVDRRFMVRAYEDIALPIGFEQFSSPPSLTVRLLSLLNIQKGFRVLEIGTGSGYAAALLSEMGAYVFSTERIGLLAQQTRRRLDKLGYGNVIIKTRDGKHGWEEAAPFDAIVSWVPFPTLPKAWAEQIEPQGGRIVVPLSDIDGEIDSQRLCLFESDCGSLQRVVLEPTVFPEGSEA